MAEYLMNFFKWLSKSFSNDGNVSGRRLTAFAVTAMYLFSRYYFVVETAKADVKWQFYGFVVDAVFVLLLFGIITAQNVIDFKNSDKNETKQ